MKKIGIYIHIPFCKHKCYYCDFCSFVCDEKMQKEYVNCIIKELENISRCFSDFDNCNSVYTDSIKNKEKYEINTIYFGGGTPSIIDENLISKILFEIKNNFNVEKNAEITIEVNPGTITENKIKVYRNCGINRMSIGLQSTNDKILKKIGRIHNYSQFENTYNLARKNEFKNINVDLMIGLPDQNLDDVKDSLNKIILKKPEHISVYSLILEENTVMEKLVKQSKYVLPDEDLERKMYWCVKNTLEQNGYFQYEISNFAKKGFESKHNTNCWKQQEYIGVGLAAHSYLNKKRFSNISDLNKYIENIQNENFEKNIIIHEIQDKKIEMNEFMILGLRMINGVNILDFENKFNINPLDLYKDSLDKLLEEKLIEISDNKIKLSNKGLDFANLVWEEFI